MKIIALLFLIIACYCEDKTFKNVPELVKYVNSLNVTTIKAYASNEKPEILVSMIKQAKFEPSTVKINEERLSFGKCQLNGPHILIYLDKDSNGNYKIKSIGRCK